MHNLFDPESALMRTLLIAWDLLILNLITMILIVPVVTLGPALKALSFCSLKMVRERDGNIVKTYFRNFKLNFLQSSILGILFLAVVLFMLWNVWLLLSTGMFGTLAIIAWTIVAFVVVLTMLYIFPMQGRFKNRIKDTIRNSFMCSLIHIPKSLFMLLIWLFIPALVYFVSENLTPVVFLYGLSFPSYFSAELYEPMFAEFEERINGKNE